MNDATPTLRLETLALDNLIRETLAAAEASINDGPIDQMVFLGNRHHAFPTALVKDPVLEPVDKLVWMVIMLAIQDTGGHSAFPGYDAIGRMANVASRSTIARAIAILRATRWLTLCARRRRINGRYRGHVYALHDEPIPLVDALHLDEHYLAFLRHALDHGHRRVATVAEAVLESIDEDIAAGENVCAEPHPVEQRLRSVVSNNGALAARCFSFTRDAVQRLRLELRRSNQRERDLEQPSNRVGHHDQNSNWVDHHDQISNLSSSSIYNNKKTTTTTSKSEVSNIDTTGENGTPLVYPKRLSDNHRGLAERHLKTLKPEQRQPILDELEGRFQAENKGMKPVFDEINFLQSLCTLARRGQFHPNLGLRVKDARDPRHPGNTPRLRIPSERANKETDAQRQTRIASAQDHLAKLRQVLSGSPAIKNQNLTKQT